MSRVSQKSGLSPSITKGPSSGIDLGKNNSVDMGQKSQPSVTSGGIGVTQEITNVGGLSVTGGVSVDISPINVGISANPSEGTVSVSSAAEIPGGILGVGGGVTINTSTGEVIEGSIGGEIGGFGINVSSSKEGGLGVEFTVQIPGTPIEFSLGLGFPPKKPTTPTTPTTPTPINAIPPRQPETKWPPPGGINIDNVRGCNLKFSYTVTLLSLNPYSITCDMILSDYP